jgi:hypothetical protein
MFGKMGCSREKVQIWAKKLGRKNKNPNNIMYIFSIFMFNIEFSLQIYYENYLSVSILNVQCTFTCWTLCAVLLCNSIQLLAVAVLIDGLEQVYSTFISDFN